MINGNPTSTDEARELASHNKVEHKADPIPNKQPTTTDEAREFARIARDHARPNDKPSTEKLPKHITNTDEAREASRIK